MRGLVLTDLDIPNTELHVSLSGANNSRGKEISPLVGWFAFEGLFPGTVRLELLTRHGDWLVEALEDVSVVAGQTTYDPRLWPINALGKLRIYSLNLQDRMGVALRKVQVRVEDENGHGTWFKSDDDGHVSLVLPTTITLLNVIGPEEDQHSISLTADEVSIRLNTTSPSRR